MFKYTETGTIDNIVQADTYSNGLSETIIGKALKKYSIPRSRVVILSKCYFGVDTTGAQPPIAALSSNDGYMVNQVGLSRKHIFDAVEASIQRLGTYIDVLQIHRLDKTTPKTEIMKALNDVVEKGWVRYLGASSMAAWEFQMLQNIADKNGWHKFISMQNYHHLLYREEEREMIPYCKETGVALIPWSPLARGLLTRPFSPAAFPTTRHSTDKYLHSQLLSRISQVDKEIIQRVEDVAKRMSVSMAAVATAWCLAKGDIPIIGLSSRSRIDEAVKSASITLTEEDVKYLDELYMPKEPTGFAR
jgi:aryl-alcohol dehydrogenase-like predicted oxidoreductase